MKKRNKEIVVNDLMQKGYIYQLSKPIGKSFHSEFEPQLTPKEMLEIGVFGGIYIRDCKDEFPKSWFKKAKLASEDVDSHLAEINYFKINASQPLSVWQEKGWIHEDDPRGWFQWYCRYYIGRRHEDDERQIKRWKQMKRHIAQVKKNCEKGDEGCRSKQRQALLHWAYDSRNM